MKVFKELTRGKLIVVRRLYCNSIIVFILFFGIFLQSSCIGDDPRNGKQDQNADSEKISESNLIRQSELDSNLNLCVEDRFLFCDLEAELKAAKRKLKAKPKKGAFARAVSKFLDHLKKAEIEKAAKLCTEYGLISFLELDLEKVDSYSLSHLKHDKFLGTVNVKLNESDREHLFYFNKRGGKWTFIGTDYWK